MTTPVSRRKALAMIVSGIGAFWTMAAATVSGVFLIGPLRKAGAGRRVELGKVTSFDSEFRLVHLAFHVSDGWHTKEEKIQVYVRLNEQSELDILSAKCSHLGCAVNWNGEGREFVCPCHAGRYGEDGAVKDGPPPAPLERLEASIEAETAYLNLA